MVHDYKATVMEKIRQQECFPLPFKCVPEEAAATLSGRLIQARAAIIRNERSPIVLSRVCGKISCWREAKRS